VSGAGRRGCVGPWLAGIDGVTPVAGCSSVLTARSVGVHRQPPVSWVTPGVARRARFTTAASRLKSAPTLVCPRTRTRPKVERKDGIESLTMRNPVSISERDRRAQHVVGNALISSAVSAPHHLSNLNETHIQLGVLLEFINAVANVGIGVLLFPILRQYRERMAIGYVATRIIESVLLLVSALFVLMLVPVGQEYLRSDAANASQLATLATLALQDITWPFNWPRSRWAWAPLRSATSCTRPGLLHALSRYSDSPDIWRCSRADGCTSPVITPSRPSFTPPGTIFEFVLPL
jgi:hypothetical protein